MHSRHECTLNKIQEWTRFCNRCPYRPFLSFFFFYGEYKHEINLIQNFLLIPGKTIFKHMAIKINTEFFQIRYVKLKKKSFFQAFYKLENWNSLLLLFFLIPDALPPQIHFKHMKEKKTKNCLPGRSFVPLKKKKFFVNFYEFNFF